MIIPVMCVIVEPFTKTRWYPPFTLVKTKNQPSPTSPFQKVPFLPVPNGCLMALFKPPEPQIQRQGWTVDSTYGFAMRSFANKTNSNPHISSGKWTYLEVILPRENDEGSELPWLPGFGSHVLERNVQRSHAHSRRLLTTTKENG